MNNKIVVDFLIVAVLVTVGSGEHEGLKTFFAGGTQYSMIASRVRRDSLSNKRNCGQDNICTPDLALRVTPSMKSYVMGSKDKIWIQIEVHNNREDSYESTLYVQVPQDLSFVKTERLDRRTDVSIQCSPPTPATNNTTLKCDIGNPLPTFAKIRFRIFFQILYGLDLIKTSYDFSISVNSTDPEDSRNMVDNYKTVIIPIQINTNVEVYGLSRPQPVQYNPKLYKAGEPIHENDIGPVVIHSYEIKCGGPSNFEEASVVILWPSFTADDEHFLYLLEQPIVDGPGQCDAVSQVNSMNLRISGDTRRRSSNNTLEVSLTSSRLKRAIDEFEQELVCDEGFKCIQILCRVGPLTTASNNNVFIHLRGRVFVNTLKADKFRGKNVNVRSKLMSRVTTFPYNVKVNPSFLGYKKVEIVTQIEEEPEFAVNSSTEIEEENLTFNVTKREGEIDTNNTGDENINIDYDEKIEYTANKSKIPESVSVSIQDMVEMIRANEKIIEEVKKSTLEMTKMLIEQKNKITELEKIIANQTQKCTVEYRI